MGKTFYEVPENAWVFRNATEARVADDQKWTPHEEVVRQWCIQELIRAYGVRIDCVEIERHVKVARERRPNRADVVVLRDGKPYIVVECKARSIKKLDDAIQQAMNYALLPDMQAAFAVATNGDAWLVRRRVNNDWIPVVDLPSFREGCSCVEWQHVFSAAQDLAPILFWLDRTVPAKEARCYFSVLQEFFSGGNEVTRATSHELLFAADNLLRVISHLDADPDYLKGKMLTSCSKINCFLKVRGIEAHFGGEGDMWELAFYAYAELADIVTNNVSIRSLETSLLRVILALLEYLKRVRPSGQIRYSDVFESIQRELRTYINLALIIRFDAALPDPLETTSVTDIRSMCGASWEEKVREERESFSFSPLVKEWWHKIWH
jgi:hypothetical protein